MIRAVQERLLLLGEIQCLQRQIDQVESQSRRVTALQAEVDAPMRHGGQP
ncbi:MAG: hypothetical protein ABSB24_14900 [Gaiellaceae bacterium]